MSALEATSCHITTPLSLAFLFYSFSHSRRSAGAMAAEKSRILVIGATGFVGRLVADAAVRLGHPTFALVRPSTAASNPAKAELIDRFKSAGVNIIHGDMYDHENLVRAIKQVDVVISIVGEDQIANQTKIIAAIKEAGNIKRFFPSEFGMDVDCVHAVEPGKSACESKAKIRRTVESSGIPYTFVVSNYFAEYFLPILGEVRTLEDSNLLKDKVVILGDGNMEVCYLTREDMGTYTIKAVDDPRTLNKILYFRPPANMASQNGLVSFWEKKTGKTLERVYVPEEQFLKQIQEASYPWNFYLSIHYSVFIKGDQTNFEIDPSFGVEASELYPDVKYTTVEEFLNKIF